MKTYTVHEPPNAPANVVDRAEHMVFVKDGFSWAALIFGPIWLLAKRLWLAFVVYMALATVISLAFEAAGVGEKFIGWVIAALHLLLGLEGSTLQRWTLDRAGWRLVGSVIGRNGDECERRFFDAWLDGDMFAKSVPLGAGPAPLFTDRNPGWLSGLWRRT
ncbi:DUF2628 domain-containing protein [Ferruginibacter sp.]